MLAALTHVREDPELWDQARWFNPAPSGDVACYGTRALLLSGIKLRRMGWRVMVVGDSVPPEIQEKVSVEAFPFAGMLSVFATAREMLGLTQAQADDLFSSYNTLEDLERKVAEVLASGADDFVQRATEEEVIPY